MKFVCKIKIVFLTQVVGWTCGSGHVTDYSVNENVYSRPIVAKEN